VAWLTFFLLPESTLTSSVISIDRCGITITEIVGSRPTTLKDLCSFSPLCILFFVDFSGGGYTISVATD